eukprot:3731944-Pyramimonas_sp.AAC.1
MAPHLVEKYASCKPAPVALLEVAPLRALQTLTSLAHLLDGSELRPRSPAREAWPMGAAEAEGAEWPARLCTY